MSPESPLPPKPGSSALRRHRWSSPGSDYFVTVNLQRPVSGLVSPALLAVLESQRTTLESTHHWRVRTWVVMPDHLHVTFTLGANSTLAEVLRLFKGRLTPALRSSHRAWQEGYYDHLMRPDEDRLPVFSTFSSTPIAPICFLRPSDGPAISARPKTGHGSAL